MWIIKHPLGDETIDYEAIARAMFDTMRGKTDDGSRFPQIPQGHPMDHMLIGTRAATVFLPIGSDIGQVQKRVRKVLEKLIDNTLTYRTIQTTTLVYTKAKLPLEFYFEGDKNTDNWRNSFRWQMRPISEISFEFSEKKIDEALCDHLFGIIYDASYCLQNHITTIPAGEYRVEITMKDFVGYSRVIDETVYLSAVAPHYQLSMYPCLSNYYTKHTETRKGIYNGKDIDNYGQIYRVFEGEYKDNYLHAQGLNAPVYIGPVDWKCQHEQCCTPIDTEGYIVVPNSGLPKLICRWCAHFLTTNREARHFVVKSPLTIHDVMNKAAVKEKVADVYADAACGLKVDGETLLIGGRYIGVTSVRQYLFRGKEIHKHPDRKIVSLPTETKLSVYS